MLMHLLRSEENCFFFKTVGDFIQTERVLRCKFSDQAIQKIAEMVVRKNTDSNSPSLSLCTFPKVTGYLGGRHEPYCQPWRQLCIGENLTVVSMSPLTL